MSDCGSRDFRLWGTQANTMSLMAKKDPRKLHWVGSPVLGSQLSEPSQGLESTQKVSGETSRSVSQSINPDLLKTWRTPGKQSITLTPRVRVYMCRGVLQIFKINCFFFKKGINQGAAFNKKNCRVNPFLGLHLWCFTMSGIWIVTAAHQDSMAVNFPHPGCVKFSREGSRSSYVYLGTHDLGTHDPKSH